MRLIATILALLVLALSAQPVCSIALPQAMAVDDCCSGGEAGCAGEGGEEAPADESSCKHCNPFQSCACCAIAALGATNLLPAVKLFPLPPAEIRWGSLEARFDSNVPSGFWQPPRRG